MLRKVFYLNLTEIRPCQVRFARKIFLSSVNCPPHIRPPGSAPWAVYWGPSVFARVSKKKPAEKKMNYSGKW